MNEPQKNSKLKFDSLSNETELIKYLDAKSRLNSTKNLYQYTTVTALVGMLRSRTLHLSNAKYMNDQLEYDMGDKTIWKDLFFSCFMMEEEESIGMWSMYAQPWRDGVKITIPKDAFRELVSSSMELIEIDQVTKRPTGRKIWNKDDYKLWISAVAYSNHESIESKDEEVLRFGNQENRILHDMAHVPELTGYIKDEAWQYEKEVRIKAQFNNVMGYERAAIQLPEKIIDSLTITPSPLFEGNLIDRIEKEISKLVHVDRSKFNGKLNIRKACDSCSLQLKEKKSNK